MRKLTTSVFYAILFLSSMLAQSSLAQVFVNGGELDLDGVFGVGSNTSYFVIDFGGNPDSATGPGDTYAFAYQFDDPTKADEALLALIAESALTSAPIEAAFSDFGGGPDGPEDPNLFVDSFTFGEDTDTPDFCVDSRFFELFTTNLVNGSVIFDEPEGVGISSITLIGGEFLGFRANVSTYPDPSGSIPPSLPIVNDGVGDFDGNGVVDCDDLDGYIGNLGASAAGISGGLASLDIDLDGTLSLDDAEEAITSLVVTDNGVRGTFIGDFNCDGDVDVLNDAFALVGSLGGPATSYSQGDANFDGVVDVLNDAFALVGNLGNTNTPN